jgi:hypothetical protein
MKITSKAAKMLDRIEYEVVNLDDATLGPLADVLVICRLLRANLIEYVDVYDRYFLTNDGKNVLAGL